MSEKSIKWEIARTYAHLHLNGRFTGISVSLKHSWISEDPEVLKILRLPPLREAGE